VGILNPFYEAVAWVLMQLHAILAVPFGFNSGWSWALSIIVLVVLMRLILVPLFVKQMHSQRKMAALAPQVAALRKKYKNDKQTMNQEVMKLYQENGANPLAGCLPLVVQLPVFFALFNVLRAVAENAEYRRRLVNNAFVYMQYVGYLRRGPIDKPDRDFSGYNFWLAKLNQFNGNFVRAEMVKAFISSDEYRKRFGQ